MPTMASEEGSQRRPIDQAGLPQVVTIEQESRVDGEPTKWILIASSIVEEGKAAGVAKRGFCPQGELGVGATTVHGNGQRRRLNREEGTGVKGWKWPSLDDPTETGR